MMQFRPNLKVNELKVNINNNVAFQEKFHAGLNIIRGQNSSGKSTIMDFLYYGLGGDILREQWRETAAKCDSVMVEVEINGELLTLWRDVEVVSQRPMKLFYGTLDEASKNATDGWEIYPFKRDSKESFSQVLFRFLGLPQVEYGETNSRLTINQVLRLLYSDQMSPVEKIFRPVRYDLAITREAVGGMLCGAYSDEYYKALIRNKEATEEFKELDNQVKFLIRTHSKEGHPLTEEWLKAESRTREQALAALNKEISDLEAQIFDAQFEDRLTLNDQEEAHKSVIALQEQVATVDELITKTALAFEDTEQYVLSLDRKLEELGQSHTVADEVGDLSFSFCPSCFAPISENDVQGACPLCKCAHDSDMAQTRILKLINEYARQKGRAENVQKDRQEQLVQLKARRDELKELWEQASRHYTVSLRSPTSEMRARLRKLNRDAGYAYRDLEDLARVKAVINEIATVSERKDRLQNELSRLKTLIENEERAQEKRLGEARAEIEEHALDFLKRDLARQSTFQDAHNVHFSFGGDRLAVNGESYFSASSMVYLRNSFFASFLFAAANDPGFLHPRFLMMDTVEDKGLEPERSQNFQRLLLEKSRHAKSEHQIIIATSMIAEELDTPDYTVGESYTHTHRTLRLPQ